MQAARLLSFHSVCNFANKARVTNLRQRQEDAATCTSVHMFQLCFQHKHALGVMINTFALCPNGQLQRADTATGSDE